MSERSRQFLELLRSPRDVLLLLRIAAWIIIQPFLVRAVSLPQALHLLTPRQAAAVPDPELEAKVIKYTDFLLRRLPYAGARAEANSRYHLLMERSCLKRSMVLYRFLRLSGRPVRFHLGVRKEQGKLKGHSWLELEQRFYFASEEQGYKTVFTYPADKSEAREPGHE